MGMADYSPRTPASRGMAKFDRTINPEYYETVKANNKAIRGLLGIQIILAPIAIYPTGMLWEAGLSANNPGEAFFVLLAILLTSISAIPIGLILPRLATRGVKHGDLDGKWASETYALIFTTPLGMIWVALWIWCLPNVWTLLPWGPWQTNWWKIFPYIGIVPMSMMGLMGLPALARNLKNPITKEDTKGMNRIEVIQSNPGQEIIVRIAEPHYKNDAWIGLYIAGSGDNEHGGRWKWMRDTSPDHISLPAQGAGSWSVRLFKDGGYTRIASIDFQIGLSNQALTQDQYMFVPEEMTWNEHNGRAKAMGRHLATISSAEENEQITRISGGKPVWIGGIRKGSGNGPGAEYWYWSDGQPWTYTNWHPGEPNNSGGGENRVHLGLQARGTWNDVNEGWRGPAVYEMSAISPTKASSNEQGNFEFIPISEYDEVWNDKGSRANQDVSVWRARVPAGCHLLGMTAKNGHSRPTFPTLVIRAGGSDIAPPERFDLVWWQERGQRRFWCWRPIPPPGYASLGDVGTLSANPPSRGDVVCVAIGCLSANKQPLGEQIWNDRGGGAPKDGAFFAQPGGTGLFRCSDDDTHNRPRGEFYIPGSIQTSQPSRNPSDVGVTHYKPGPRLTYADSEAYAAKMGGRLLTLDEAKALMGGRALYPGEDQWCAVQGRDWVQVGDLHHHPGKSHNRECGGYPPWGDDANNTRYGNPSWNYVALYKIQQNRKTLKNSNDTRGSGIDILSFNQGQPIRFRINNRPSSNDAWVGIYPANAGDHEHEERWSWLRDVDVNNASLPGQAKGRWSIRVFSDGGYTLHDRVDFEITDDYKTEVWMQNVRIDDNRLNGLALEHPKHGTANVTTSPIVERTRQGDVNRFETYNTIYLVNDRDLQDEDVSGNSDREKINAELLMRAFQDQLQKKE